MSRISLVVSLALVAGSASAQLKPGQLLVSAPGTFGSIGNSGHLITVDIVTGARNRLGGTSTFPQNRGVFIENATTAWWGGGGSTGSVDKVTIGANGLTVDRWNTDNPTGGDIRDLAVVGNRVYFACWEGGTQTNRLYSLATGTKGTVKEELNLRTAGYVISIPRMATSGGKIYIAARNRGDNNMVVVEFDPSNGSHKKLIERTTSIGHVEGMSASDKELFLIGDAASSLARTFVVDIATGKEVRASGVQHGGTGRPRNHVYIPESGDLVSGNRNGFLDIYNIGGMVDDRAPAPGAGFANNVYDPSGITPRPAALGVDYFPFTGAGSHKVVENGCVGDANKVPTGFVMGQGKRAQPLKIGVHGRFGAPAFLLWGRTQVKLDLTGLGAPTCFLGSDFSLLFVPITLNSEGMFTTVIDSLPVDTFMQWGVFDGSNNLQISFSETRKVDSQL